MRERLPWVMVIAATLGCNAVEQIAERVRIVVDDDNDRSRSDDDPPRSPAERPPDVAPPPGPRPSSARSNDKPRDPLAPPATPPSPIALPPATSSGAQGTLVGIAIGGTCAFAVNGVPRETSSSMRTQVPFGPHTVTCTAGGRTLSQSVTVTASRPGIASFRL